MTGSYDDMIHLPHHVSEKHPRMSAADRAAQFAPFAALTGHSAAIQETARLTDRRIDLDDGAKAVLDRKQCALAAIISEQPEVSVTWFEPDERKAGGRYVTTIGRLQKTDSHARVLVLTDGTRIPLDDILALESDWLTEIEE